MSTAIAEQSSESPRMHAVPPSRRRGMFIGLLVAVFMSGGVAGGGLGMLITQRKYNDCLRHPERIPTRMMNMFRTELDLTDEQAKEVEAIVRKHHDQIEAIRAEVRPRFVAEFNGLHTEVRAVLSPEQQQQWDELRERFRKDFPRGKRERKNRDDDAKKT